MTCLLEGVQETCAHSNLNHSLNEGFQDHHALTFGMKIPSNTVKEFSEVVPIQREKLIKEGIWDVRQAMAAHVSS
ncbi:hypothetical protein V6N11_043299 [Hibiscus sabdariffa]|uniref:Uncharacterized protein n=1 Tax=Hibiscus sabdariffa TaxID=183260 RepID=A0ABR2QYZ4_9ROSI